MIFGYANVGKLKEGSELVDEMMQRDNFSWMAMISWCVHHDWPKEALEFYRMRLRHWIWMWRFWSVYQTCMGNSGSVEETRQNFDKMVDKG